MKRQETDRLQVRFPKHELDRLRSLATKADVSMSSLIRRLLRDAVPRWEQKLEEDRLALL